MIDTLTTREFETTAGAAAAGMNLAAARGSLQRTGRATALTLILAAVLAVTGCATSPGEQATAPAPEWPSPHEAVPPAAVELEAEPPEDVAPPPALGEEGVDLDDPDLDTVGEPDSPAALLQAGLEACESARQFWQEGHIEDALAALDHAMELMLAVPATTEDPTVLQQRDDLRQLIARRVVEIHASRHTAAGAMALTIPLIINEHVEREIRSFQGPEREFFLRSYRRSGRYRPMILEQLRDAGMPEQLSWLPLIESGFNPRALSSARALGVWQFIPSTGYRFGLRRDYWVDNRMDPVEATRAATEYLTELHGLFGDWMTALAGYNWGENAVLRTINRQSVSYLDDFWDLYRRMPRETSRYVPRFLATLAIVQDPERYGFELPEPDPPLTWETALSSRSVRLDALERQMGLAAGTLQDLNPELRRRVTPAREYALRVPPGFGDALPQAVAGLPEVPPEPEVLIHRVRRGETLQVIARRYRTSVAAVQRANRISNPNRIWPGQRLRIPTRGGAAPAAAATRGGTAPARATAGPTSHTVRAGDTLWRLARTYGTTMDRIRRDNNLTGDVLRVGQVLTIGGAGTAGSRTHTVSRGETLGQIAQRYGTTVSAIQQVNGLGRSTLIRPGQVLALPAGAR